MTTEKETSEAGERTPNVATTKTFTAPTGARITGTLETVLGVARVEGWDEHGEPIYSGDTEIWWDEQRTVIRDDEFVYVDANGDEWLQSQLVEAEGGAQ
jgi:hypothetical protein